jgi:DNA-nicking Smr family endonuclease
MSDSGIAAKESFNNKSSDNGLSIKRNKNGIRLIEKNQDVHDFFHRDDEPVLFEERKKFIHDKNDEGSIKNKKNNKNKKSKHITKNGIPVLDGIDDHLLFNGVFENSLNKDDGLKCEADVRLSDNDERLKKKKHNTNKHGIPLLIDDTPWDLPDERKDIKNEEFVRLLNHSLGQKPKDVLMNEKGVRYSRKKPLTLKEKLKRYPIPQGLLDLHGYTSVKAELRAETFIKQSYRNQLNTVSIVVGKGLHSEDGAVLPDVIENLLMKLKKENVVLAYEWENVKKSTSGSLTVYLENMDL